MHFSKWDRFAPITAKFLEVVALGAVVAAVLWYATPVWVGNKYYFLDHIQKSSVYLDVPPAAASDYPFRIITVDIDDESCAQWAVDLQYMACYAFAELPPEKLSEIIEQIGKKLARRAPAADTAAKIVVALDILLPLTQSWGQMSAAQQWLRDLVFALTESSCGDEPVPEFKLRNSDEVLDIQPLTVVVPVPLFSDLRRAVGSGNGKHRAMHAYPTIFHCPAAEGAGGRAASFTVPKGHLRFAHAEQVIDADGKFRRTLYKIPLVDGATASEDGKHDGGAASYLRPIASEVCADVYGSGSSRLCPEPDKKDKDGALWTKYSFGVDVLLPYAIDEAVRNEVERFHSAIAPYQAVRFLQNDTAFAGLMASSEKLDAVVVVVGASATQRRDYMPTPIDFAGVETPGIVVIANQIIGTLANQTLHSVSTAGKLIEKAVLICIMAGFATWYWHGVHRRAKVRRLAARSRTFSSFASDMILFVLMIGTVLAIGTGIVVYFGVYRFGHGDVTDPAGLLIALVLDLLIEVSCPLGHWVKEKIGGESH